MQFHFLLIVLTLLLVQSCSNERKVEYTNELPPTETIQTIDTVNHNSANVKDPVFQQKN